MYDCFFFKQKTAYEMRISDWSSDVCSSDLVLPASEALETFGLRLESAEELDLVAVGDLAPVRDRLHPEAIRALRATDNRSEERRVGKECVSTCRSRWSPSH